MSDNRVIMRPCSATQALILKNELTQAGLQVDQDYEWRFVTSSSHWDDLGEYQTYPHTAWFDFRDPGLATFYRLKWNAVT